MSKSLTSAGRAVVVMLALGATAISCSDPEATAPSGHEDVKAGGPLSVDNAHTTYLPVTEGQVFSDGFEILSVTGDKPATLTSAQPEGGETTLSFLGARVGLPGRPHDFNQNMTGFPPKAVPAKYQAPLKGTVLEPGSTYMLILGYEVTDDQTIGRRTGVRVSYEIEGQPYQVTLKAGLVTCPEDMSDSECEKAAG